MQPGGKIHASFFTIDIVRHKPENFPDKTRAPAAHPKAGADLNEVGTGGAVWIGT
jgi:hypothetical protein